MASNDKITICHTCDLVHQHLPLAAGESAYCSRCGSRLYGAHRASINQALALTLASTCLFLSAHLLPFIEITSSGLHGQIHLVSIVAVLYDTENLLLALAAVLFLLVAPLSVLLIHSLLLTRIMRQHRDTQSILLMRWASRLAPWNILEIFFVGVIVALVKLSSMTEITLHQGFWLFAVLVGTTMATRFVLHEEDLWECLESC